VIPKLKLVLLGPPASGKGTQANLLAEALGIPAVSTGVIIRAEIAQGSPLGEKARPFLDAGQLLPDRQTLEVVAAWLGKAGSEGFILDGFPRTVPQARAFDALLERSQTSLDAAVFLDVPRDILRERILGRLQCPRCGRVYRRGDADGPAEGGSCPGCGSPVRRRDDDTAETFALRYHEYTSKTVALLRYYGERKLLKTIDGNGSPTRVLGDVLDALGLPVGRSSPLTGFPTISTP